MLTNDADAIGAYMSNNWMIVSTAGNISGKDAFLHEIRTGNLTHNRFDADYMQVALFDQSAIVVSRGTSGGFYKGRPFSFYEWSTDVFIKENSRWLCVHTMLTPAVTEKG